MMASNCERARKRGGRNVAGRLEATLIQPPRRAPHPEGFASVDAEEKHWRLQQVPGPLK
jgi:hypothetical protein